MTLFDQYERRFPIKTKKIIEGKKILNIGKNKLEKFNFVNNINYDIPELRELLLVSRTQHLAMDILNSEGIFKEWDKYYSNRYKNVPKQDNTIDTMDDDEVENDDDDEYDDIYKAEGVNSGTNFGFMQEIFDDIDDHDNDNVSFHNTVECYEYDEKENANEEEYNEDGRVSSVVVSVVSKNVHDISLGKHGLSLNEEILKSRVAYKKVKQYA